MKTLLTVLFCLNLPLMGSDKKPLTKEESAKLKENNILHWIADTLPSKLYADASHPLTQGYQQLAEKISIESSFTEWLVR